MREDILLSSIKNLESKIKNLQLQENEIEGQLYRNYDGKLKRKLEKLQFQEEDLILQVNMQLDVLEKIKDKTTFDN